MGGGYVSTCRSISALFSVRTIKNLLTGQGVTTKTVGMPRKKTVLNIEEDLPLPAMEDYASIPDEKQPNRTRKRGVFVPLTESGDLDMQRVRADNKLDDARKALAIEPGSGKPAVEVNPDFVRGLYKGVEFVIGFAGGRFLHWPHELTAELHYSADQLDKLESPTKTVIEKLSPKWLAKHQEIATLAVVFTAVTTEMVQAGLRSFIIKHPEMIQVQPAVIKPNGHAEGNEATT